MKRNEIELNDYENYFDINGDRISVGDMSFWHDEAGYDEDGSNIVFTIIDEDGNGYFNLAIEDEKFPERWAYHTELEVLS